MLRAEGVSFRVDGRELLHPTSIVFGDGLFHVIMGANGAGKSTLLKLLAGDQKPSTGRVLLDDRPLEDFSKKELATRRAVLSQHYNITFPIAVHDIVLMGRYPYFSGRPAPRDFDICRQALVLMDMQSFAERDYNTLSGGEAQKVQMSRVLAQIWSATEGEKQLLFLDEPVSHLDVKFQYQLLQAARDLSKKGTTVIAILHDINLALSFADRILFMKQGAIVHDLDKMGKVDTSILREVFDVETVIMQTGNRPIVVIREGK